MCKNQILGVVYRKIERISFKRYSQSVFLVPHVFLCHNNGMVRVQKGVRHSAYKTNMVALMQ